MGCLAPHPENFTHASQFATGVPIEVSPFAHSAVLRSLRTKLGSPKSILRMGHAKAGPVVTDNGNFIIDAPFTEDVMKRPHEVIFVFSR